jgi:hypothetical protein
MGSVTVVFQGVCVHFKNGVAAGVPHRVVLPNATSIMAGLLTVESLAMPEPVTYYLIPHFPQIELSPPNEPLTIPNLMTDGDIFSGVRLQIANAVHGEMTYDGEVIRLTDYDPDYIFSSDVVVNGNALCYFDFFGGRFVAGTETEGSIYASISVETDGSPMLLATALASTSTAAVTIPLTPTGQPEPADVILTVKNLEPASLYKLGVDQQNGSYDLLLSYLTARGGIPQSIVKPTPGMSLPLISATNAEIGVVLEKMGNLLINGNPTQVANYIRRKLMPHDQVTPSCSDTQYP